MPALVYTQLLDRELHWRSTPDGHGIDAQNGAGLTGCPDLGATVAAAVEPWVRFHP